MDNYRELTNYHNYRKLRLKYDNFILPMLYYYQGERKKFINPVNYDSVIFHSTGVYEWEDLVRSGQGASDFTVHLNNFRSIDLWGIESIIKLFNENKPTTLGETRNLIKNHFLDLSKDVTNELNEDTEIFVGIKVKKLEELTYRYSSDINKYVKFLESSNLTDSKRLDYVNRMKLFIKGKLSFESISGDISDILKLRMMIKVSMTLN